MTPASSLPTPRYVLGIEAATPSVGVALATTEGHLTAYIGREGRRPASKWLLEELDRMLAALDAGPQNLAAIAVSHGPGMFTGLRVGLSLAKTLAHGRAAPLYTYSTLALLAKRTATLDDTPVCALLDARRGELYSGLYVGARCVRAERVESVEDLLDALDARNEAILLAGSGVDVAREALVGRLGARARFVPAPWNRPGADVAALAGARDLAQERPGEDPLAVAPVYLRVSDAERRHPPKPTA